MALPLRPFLAAALFLCIFPVNADAQIFPPPKGQMETKHDRLYRFQDRDAISITSSYKRAELDHQRLYLSLRADFISATSSKPPDYVGVVFASWSLGNNR